MFTEPKTWCSNTKCVMTRYFTISPTLKTMCMQRKSKKCVKAKSFIPITEIFNTKIQTNESSKKKMWKSKCKRKDWTDAPGHAFLCDNSPLWSRPTSIQRLTYLGKKKIAGMSIKLYPVGHLLVGSYRILSLTVNLGFLIGSRTSGSNIRPLGVAP